MSRSSGFRPKLERLETRDVPSLTLQSWKLPAGTNFPGNLTVGGNGAVWFSNGLASKVGYITSSGATTIFNTATVSKHGLDGLTKGPDNNIWFIEFWDHKFGKITSIGHITQYKLTGNHGPTSITLGPDRNFWVTAFDNHVGRITPSGAVTWFQHKGEGVKNIVSSHGALYVQENDKIGRIGTNGAVTGEFKVPQQINDITAGADGNVWFTAQGSHIGRLTPTGQITEYVIPGGNLGHIAYVNGNLFVRQGDNLVEVSTSGKVLNNQQLEFIAGDGSVAKGPGGVWYAEGVLDKIGVASGG
jgi:streptogramin lyase